MKSESIEMLPKPPTPTDRVGNTDQLEAALSDSNLIEDIEIFRRAKEKMGRIDDKMLLWCLKGTVLLDVPMFSYQSALVDELEDRLFPDYDGDKVTLEDFGWRTPDGLIIYSDVFCTLDHGDSDADPCVCCQKCPHCFRRFKKRFYVGHPEICSHKPSTSGVLANPARGKSLVPETELSSASAAELADQNSVEMQQTAPCLSQNSVSKDSSENAE